MSHWQVKDKKKLSQNIDSYIEGHHQGSGRKITVGMLFYITTNYGYQPRNIKTRTTSNKPTYNEIRVSVDEANDKLKRLIFDFFQDGQR